MELFNSISHESFSVRVKMDDTFYYEASHNENNKVWSRFNEQKKDYVQGKSFYDEKDTKKDSINTLTNKDENIEDKYYGEGKNIYEQDKKYFHPDDKTIETESWMYWLVGAGIFLYAIQ